jgi:hypothetical protein
MPTGLLPPPPHPQVLHLKRFVVDASLSRYEKCRHRVDFPEVLDVAPFAAARVRPHPSPTPDTPPAAGGAPEQWECPQCTLLNEQVRAALRDRWCAESEALGWGSGT